MTRTILVAHEDQVVRKALQLILESEGYDVVHAESGRQVIALANTLEIDVFLLRVQLGQMTGADLCRAIRHLPPHRSTPIIIVTNSTEDAALEEAFKAGADDFLREPFTSISVRARMGSHLKRLEYFQRLERVLRALKRYLSKRTLHVVENWSHSGTLPPPQEEELAVCFTDLRGFTAFSEETEPNQLFALVSALLAEQVQIIDKFGGYVDKFGGDGVMAIFDGPDKVIQSCLCALTILDSARVTESADHEKIRRFGIGIHTGHAVIGNLGSPERLDYSAIGSTVNLAARLCGQAEGNSVVVSKAVRDAAQNDSRLKFHSERAVAIRGIKDAVTVYTLTRP